MENLFTCRINTLWKYILNMKHLMKHPTALPLQCWAFAGRSQQGSPAWWHRTEAHMWSAPSWDCCFVKSCQDRGQVLNKFLVFPFLIYSNWLNKSYGRPTTTNLPLTSHSMREYVCQCLSASATGTLKTSGTSQTRVLHGRRRTYHMLFAYKKEGT